MENFFLTKQVVLYLSVFLGLSKIPVLNHVLVISITLFARHEMLSTFDFLIAKN